MLTVPFSADYFNMGYLLQNGRYFSNYDRDIDALLMNTVRQLLPASSIALHYVALKLNVGNYAIVFEFL